MDAALYSEALEQQLALLRYYESPMGAALLEMHAEGATDDTGRLADQRIAPMATRHYLLDPLREGATYYWAPLLCELLSHAAPSMPDWTLTEAVVPSYAGFMWFANGLPVPRYMGPAWSDGAGKSEDPGRLTAISWMPFADDDGVIRLSVGFYAAHMFRAAGVLSNLLAWKNGQPMSEMLQLAETLPHTEPETPGRRVAEVRYFACALALMSEVLVAPTATAARACRRRMERDGWQHEPVIRAVQLRRSVSGAQRSSSEETPDWSCQWFVRGHWRQQSCGPGRVHRRPTWVLPHVKGPADKPLKPPGTKVFAVVR